LPNVKPIFLSLKSHLLLQTSTALINELSMSALDVFRTLAVTVRKSVVKL